MRHKDRERGLVLSGSKPRLNGPWCVVSRALHPTQQGPPLPPLVAWFEPDWRERPVPLCARGARQRLFSQPMIQPVLSVPAVAEGANPRLFWGMVELPSASHVPPSTARPAGSADVGGARVAGRTVCPAEQQASPFGTQTQQHLIDQGVAR